MKKTTHAGKSEKELLKSLYEQREALSKFNFGKAGSRTRNVKEGRLVRKEIARIMTELNKVNKK